MRDGDGLLCGIRPMVQDIADATWLASPSLDRAFDCLQANDLAFDALVTTTHLPALHLRLQRQPGLRAVVDHAAKPSLVEGDHGPWHDWMDALAQLPDLHCKLSGLLTLLDADASECQLEPYVESLFETFGADRLMWGSDWPVLTTHADYRHWLQLAQSLTARFAPGRQAEVFGLNAIRLLPTGRGSRPLHFIGDPIMTTSHRTPSLSPCRRHHS